MTYEQHIIDLGDGRKRAVRVSVWQSGNANEQWVATAETGGSDEGWSFVRAVKDTREGAISACLAMAARG